MGEISYSKQNGGKINALSLQTLRKHNNHQWGALYDFCPVCGSRGTLEERSKGRDTALEIAERVRELIPDLERTRAEYLKYYNEYQKLSLRLFDSCRRGNISRDEIPIYRPEKSYRTKATLKSKAKKKS